MMIFSLVAMTGLEKYCITSAYLQWLCHSGERPVACGPIVYNFDEDSIKNEVAIVQTLFSPLYVFGRLKVEYLSRE